MFEMQFSTEDKEEHVAKVIWRKLHRILCLLLLVVGGSGPQSNTVCRGGSPESPLQTGL